jgi:uncharacterized membrane protein YgcG
MKKLFISLAIAVVSIIGLGTPAVAAEIPSPPVLEYPLVDAADILSSPDEKTIVARLNDIRDITEHEYAVAIIDSLEGESIEDFALKTANAWGIGDDKINDGVLLVIAMQERELRLEVGSGLTDVLSDSRAKNIVDNTISPLLSDKDYTHGIIAGFDEIEDLFVSPVAINTSPDEDKDENWVFILVVTLSIFIAIAIAFFTITHIYDKRRAKRIAEEKETQRLKRESYYNSPKYAELVENNRKRRETDSILDKKALLAHNKRMRAYREEEKQRGLLRQAEAKKFYDTLSPAAKRRVNDANTTIKRQAVLTDEIRKARASGTLNGSTDTDNALVHTLLTFSLFNTITGDIYNAPRSHSSSSDSSGSSSDSHRSSSSSHNSGYSGSSDSGSSFSGGSFDGGGSSGNF